MQNKIDNIISYKAKALTDVVVRLAPDAKATAIKMIGIGLTYQLGKDAAAVWETRGHWYAKLVSFRDHYDAGYDLAGFDEITVSNPTNDTLSARELDDQHVKRPKSMFGTALFNPYSNGLVRGGDRPLDVTSLSDLRRVLYITYRLLTASTAPARLYGLVVLRKITCVIELLERAELATGWVGDVLVYDIDSRALAYALASRSVRQGSTLLTTQRVLGPLLYQADTSMAFVGTVTSKILSPSLLADPPTIDAALSAFLARVSWQQARGVVSPVRGQTLTKAFTGVAAQAKSLLGVLASDSPIPPSTYIQLLTELSRMVGIFNLLEPKATR